ncbi:unnamed protein product [Cylindrotheca closterium]|uniref:Uncharacterized protein n=1 Tax=Cylindrotheca closterium TaxID=2856 RepID=A0AAD2FX62_9STRA|nr:unnamed protein product [Cylindrotheca closterium]
MENTRGGEDETDSQVKKESKAEDNVESSSSSSENGKGSGSGGYNADCSSSDTSSLEAVKGSVPEKEMKNMSIGADGNEETTKNSGKTGPKHAKKRKSSKASKTTTNDEEDSDAAAKEGIVVQSSQESTASSAPQWKGFRVHHPMDPRIDLSTVAHVQTSAIALPNNVDVPYQHLDLYKSLNEQNPVQLDWLTIHAPPTADQYHNLMKVVHPFYNAHGIIQDFGDATVATETSKKPAGSLQDSSDNSSDQKSSGEDKKTDKAGAREKRNTTIPSLSKREAGESDASSMVVLARAKKKKNTKKPSDDQANDGSNTSSNAGSNASSVSSEKKVRIHHPNNPEARNHPDGANDRNDDQYDGDAGEESPQVEPIDHQESSSSASVEERNAPVIPQAAPQMHFQGPAVVSEYSSSRTGGSGESNGNGLSTSGSGSGANTGSGTGSGSNQGGSSGSGNDHGVISSNGNGSSGSGNDVKGSSEDTMENSGENNSGGNSDESNTKKKSLANPPNIAGDESLRQNTGKGDSKDVMNQSFSERSIGSKEHDAVREKKLQDKKRKRMNMRREYEEKVQQEMESSEDSNGGEDVAIKAGRPITLDRVLSFSSVPRIVMKAFPPFLVVHTNAAYSRLSGIDSHSAVGKPVSSLLSLPEQDAAREQGTNEESQIENSSVAVATSATILNREAQASNHQEAEAAGRARAASAEDNTTEMSLERLVAASGYGKHHPISVLSKPQNMVGRNVTASNPSTPSKKRSREEGSNGSSITSNNEGSLQFLKHNMSISPIVSSPESFNVDTTTEKDLDGHHHKTKRRKHHPSNDALQTGHRKRQFVTHFVIQLEKFDDSGKFPGNASQSSASTKPENKRQRQRQSQQNSAAESGAPSANNDEDNEPESESDQSEPIVAVA